MRQHIVHCVGCVLCAEVDRFYFGKQERVLFHSVKFCWTDVIELVGLRLNLWIGEKNVPNSIRLSCLRACFPHSIRDVCDGLGWNYVAVGPGPLVRKLFHLRLTNEWIWNIGGVVIDGGNYCIRRKIYSRATSSTTNLRYLFFLVISIPPVLNVHPFVSYWSYIILALRL
jgi:hypothetical protein